MFYDFLDLCDDYLGVYTCKSLSNYALFYVLL